MNMEYIGLLAQVYKRDNGRTKGNLFVSPP